MVVPVVDPDQPQPGPADRAAAVPGDAGHARPDPVRDRGDHEVRALAGRRRLRRELAARARRGLRAAGRGCRAGRCRSGGRRCGRPRPTPAGRPRARHRESWRGVVRNRARPSSPVVTTRATRHLPPASERRTLTRPATGAPPAVVQRTMTGTDLPSLTSRRTADPDLALAALQVQLSLLGGGVVGVVPGVRRPEHVVRRLALQGHLLGRVALGVGGHDRDRSPGAVGTALDRDLGARDRCAARAGEPDPQGRRVAGTRAVRLERELGRRRLRGVGGTRHAHDEGEDGQEEEQSGPGRHGPTVPRRADPNPGSWAASVAP